MQTETTKLIIHTGAGPDAAREEAKQGGPKKARASKVKAGEVVVWGLVQENEADGLGEKAKDRTADAGRKARERSVRRERAAALRRARIGKLLSPRRGAKKAAPRPVPARRGKRTVWRTWRGSPPPKVQTSVFLWRRKARKRAYRNVRSALVGALRADAGLQSRG